MKLEFSRQIFETFSKVKFNQNLCSGSRVVSRGRTDMTKPIVANAPKMVYQGSATEDLKLGLPNTNDVWYKFMAT